MEDFRHMMWYKIWCDMVWYDIWYDDIMIWCAIWYDIWYDGIICYDMMCDMLWYDMIYDIILYMIWYDMKYLLTAFWLTPGDSSTVHIYTQTIHEQNKETGFPELNIHNNKNT